MKSIYLLFIAINLIPFFGFSQEGEKEITQSHAKDFFYEGIQNFQKKEFEKAYENFEKTLTLAPNNAGALYNFGLSAEKLQKSGVALGAWRKAISIDPYLSQARESLNRLLSAMQKKHNLERFTDFLTTSHALFLNRINIHISFFLTFLFGLLFSYYVIQYFSKRKKAYLNDTAFPKLKPQVILFTLLFFCSLLASIFKVTYLSQPKATLVASKVTLRSAPSEESSSLFEIYEGQHMILKNQHEKWYQVQLPKGLKGWLLGSQIYKDEDGQIW